MSDCSWEGGAPWWRLGRWWQAFRWQGGWCRAMMTAQRGARQWGGAVRKPTRGGCGHFYPAYILLHVVKMKHIVAIAVQLSSKSWGRAHGSLV